MTKMKNQPMVTYRIYDRPENGTAGQDCGTFALAELPQRVPLVTGRSTGLLGYARFSPILASGMTIPSTDSESETSDECMVAVYSMVNVCPDTRYWGWYFSTFWMLLHSGY